MAAIRDGYDRKLKETIQTMQQSFEVEKQTMTANFKCVSYHNRFSCRPDCLVLNLPLCMLLSVCSSKFLPRLVPQSEALPDVRALAYMHCD